MEPGWVYILVNSSMPGLAKVGRTTRQPQERAAELSAATGVATPFIVAFHQAFADCEQGEREVHAELDRRGVRVAANREFFSAAPADIAAIILDVAGAQFPAADPVEFPSAEGLLEEGDCHLFGKGEALQDAAEAVRCYRLAMTRGSLIAYERLGMVYARIGRGRAARRRAMQPLKEGVRRGNYYCFCDMAELYAAEGHWQNFAKAWDLFFARRQEAFLPELEIQADRYVTACRRYVANCLAFGQTPMHLPELKQRRAEIVAALLEASRQASDQPEAKGQVVAMLRWVYEVLMPDEAASNALVGHRPDQPRFWFARRTPRPA